MNKCKCLLNKIKKNRLILVFLVTTVLLCYSPKRLLCLKRMLQNEMKKSPRCLIAQITTIRRANCPYTSGTGEILLEMPTATPTSNCLMLNVFFFFLDSTKLI